MSEQSEVPEVKKGQYWAYYFSYPNVGSHYAIFYGFSEEEAKERYATYFDIPVENVPDHEKRESW